MPKPSPFVTLDRRVRILQARFAQLLRLQEIVDWIYDHITKEKNR